jgi:hypothetical protein
LKRSGDSKVLTADITSSTVIIVFSESDAILELLILDKLVEIANNLDGCYNLELATTIYTADVTLQFFFRISQIQDTLELFFNK